MILWRSVAGTVFHTGTSTRPVGIPHSAGEHWEPGSVSGRETELLVWIEINLWVSVASGPCWGGKKQYFFSVLNSLLLGKIYLGRF